MQLKSSNSKDRMEIYSYPNSTKSTVARDDRMERAKVEQIKRKLGFPEGHIDRDLLDLVSEIKC